VAQIYQKTISLAKLEAAFRLPPTLWRVEDPGLTPRVNQLYHFLSKDFDRLAAFDDVKAYVSDFTFAEVRWLLNETLPSLAKDVSDTVLPSFPYHVLT
jgi:hypothetical protein